MPDIQERQDRSKCLDGEKHRAGSRIPRLALVLLQRWLRGIRLVSLFLAHLRDGQTTRGRLSAYGYIPKHNIKRTSSDAQSLNTFRTKREWFQLLDIPMLWYFAGVDIYSADIGHIPWMLSFVETRSYAINSDGFSMNSHGTRTCILSQLLPHKSWRYWYLDDELLWLISASSNQ